MSHKIGKRCPRCGKQYQLGYNGIKGMCDECAGVQRDNNDFAWHPGTDSMKLFEISTGEIVTLTRKEAFKK